MSSSNQTKNTENNATSKDNPKKDNTSKDSTQNKTPKTKTPEELQEERVESILKQCRRIWGSETDYDLDCKWVKLDEVEGWSVEIRKRYGDAVGAKEFWTLPKETEEEAWVTMDYIVNQKVVICLLSRWYAWTNVWDRLEYRRERSLIHMVDAESLHFVIWAFVTLAKEAGWASKACGEVGDTC